MNASEWIRQARAKYVAATDLIEVTSQSDPHNEPYKSKYQGREILLSLLSDLQTHKFGKCDEEVTHSIHMIEILFHWQISVVSMDVEETTVASRHSECAHKLLEEHFDQNLKLILFHLKVANTFSLILCSFADYERASSVLKRAENLYKDWSAVRDKDPSFPTLVLIDAFDQTFLQNQQSETHSSVKEVEQNYTQTVYYLAQVLEKQGQCDLAAKYCSETLVRQFQCGDFDHSDWSVNAATLSQYYACHNKFTIARRLLAVAQSQLHKVRDKQQQDEEEDELFRKRQADLDRIFVKYCLILMDKEEDEDEVDTGCADSRISFLRDPEGDTLEQDIPVVRANSYETALPIFHFANKHLSSAVTFLTLNEHASDYADCILDESMLFQRLISFQSDPGKICKLHKRRIDLLQKLLSELNPVYFQSHVRRILFELGENYSEMFHHKLVDAEKANDDQVVRCVVAKLNSLISKAIQQFGRFIDTFRDKNGQLPVRFEEDDVRPVLIACFASGRLHSKRISSSPNDQLQNWTHCESLYQQIVDYIDKNPDHEQLILHEVKVIREMLPLIPEKKKLILSATIF